MLIDNVEIEVGAGKGGDGAVAFSSIKMTLGPTGASGGNGGSVYVESVADLGALRHFRSKKTFKADNGENGRKAFRDGHDGKDLVLYVPRGTVIRNLTNKVEYELTEVGQRVMVAKGGHGGKGNFHYKSSINTSPKQFQHGLPGEKCRLQLELKFIADIGLIGLPNIGKSSFLNEITHAQSHVANYPFTTLEPHLGVYHNLILADIPGLIEGASIGKGLGIKFLRHIERTHILFHFIDAASKNSKEDYDVVRKELGNYNKLLLEKPEYIVISRSDTVDEDQLEKVKKALKPCKKEIVVISVYDFDKMNEMRKVLDKIEKNIKVSPVEKKEEIN